VIREAFAVVRRRRRPGASIAPQCCTGLDRCRAYRDLEADLVKIVAATVIDRSQYANALNAYLKAAVIVGARPIEWHGAARTIVGSTAIPTLPNAKDDGDDDQGRVHQPPRHNGNPNQKFRSSTKRQEQKLSFCPKADIGSAAVALASAEG
jgi:hypothetical protein